VLFLGRRPSATIVPAPAVATATHGGRDLWALASPLAAAVIALLAALASSAPYRAEIRDYDRFHLSAFDPYVYVAMAEHPTFFTVAPWGYRILTPWTVHLLGGHNLVGTFYVLTLVSLAVAGAMLFLFLRAVGHPTSRSLAATAVFGLLPPVAESVRGVFLAEPLTVALEIAFLLGVQTGASALTLCLLLTVMAASKEIWLLLLPLVYVAHVGSPFRRALTTLASGVPPLLVTLALHWWWAPQIHIPRPDLGVEALARVWATFRTSWPETWPALVLGGVTPAAVLGLWHPGGWAFVRRYGLLALALIAVVLTAWLYVPSRYVRAYFGANSMRLMVYVLPLSLPLALFAIDRLWPAWRRPPVPAPPRRTVALAAAAATIFGVSFVYIVPDRYRRLPLHEHRDGPFVLTFCRESLRTARRLDATRTVTFDLTDGDAEERPESRPMTSIRWFLLEGWNDGGPYSVGPVSMDGEEASVVLPCLRPRPMAVTLDLATSPDTDLDVSVNGHALARWRDGAPLFISAVLLFRGDNLLTLRRRAGRVRLRRLSYRTFPAAADPADGLPRPPPRFARSVGVTRR
jgi:hypothetical protein